MLVGVGFMLLATSSFGQRILHDATRDKTAQDAESTAKEMTSGDLFNKMLHNADLQAKQNITTQMDFVRQEMRAKLESFAYWELNPDQPGTKAEVPVQVHHLADGSPFFIEGICKSVKCELQGVRTKINAYLADPSAPSQAQIEEHLKRLATKKKQLDEELKKLQDSQKENDPFVAQAFSLLDDHGKEALDYAKKVADFAESKGFQAKGITTALNKIGDGLDQALSLYKALNGIWQGQKAVSRDPASLRPPKEQIDLQLLALEQDHIQAVALIQARKVLELGAALERVEDALAQVDTLRDEHAFMPGERIEDSLNRMASAHNRQALVASLDELHEVAAVIAEEDAAGRLAALRLSSEERLYSIRKSAVNSSTYDLTIQAAAQRLALYWKGGIKPEELAQWAFYVANTAGVAAIAAK
jgi:hypothetical protein